ncbi:hypothetical protein DIPPA_50441 [Diplonema papillatum]|nr:hypothetical protein DIPPA_50441 [Diplonema papillatum]
MRVIKGPTSVTLVDCAERETSTVAFTTPQPPIYRMVAKDGTHEVTLLGERETSHVSQGRLYRNDSEEHHRSGDYLFPRDNLADRVNQLESHVARLLEHMRCAQQPFYASPDTPAQIPHTPSPLLHLSPSRQPIPSYAY